jgi:ATP-binding cassette subfamily C protein
MIPPPRSPHCGNCSIEMSTPDAPARQHPEGALVPLVRTLAGADIAGIAAYVLLSLCAALAGSIAALILVPLVQPGHVSGFIARLPRLPADPGALALWFAVASCAFALARWLAARLAARLSSRYAMQLRREVHASLTGAPLASLANATSAEIANVLTYNVELVNQGFTALLQLLVAGATTLVSLAFALWVSPILTLALPVVVGFGLVTSRLFGHEQSRVSRRYVSDMTLLFWLSEDFPRRLRLVRSFQRVEAERKRYAEISARLCHGYRRQQELVATGRLLLELLAAVSVAAIFAIAHRWHGVDSASLIAVGLLLGRLLPYAGATRQSFHQLRVAAPGLELWRRYRALAAGDASPRPVPQPLPSGGEGLHIERIRWSLPSGCLEARGLELRPGELILVCGHSGAGKSSLMDVLAGLVAPQAFSARLNGVPIDFDSYRQRVGRGAYLSQGVRPWQPTVRECLLWAAPAATDGELHQAMLDVGLAAPAPDGQAAVEIALRSSAEKLSGGEVQRLLLAQVMLRRPTLALLDESTGALDAASELAVLATLKRRLRDTVLIVVSHRAGVSELADQRLEIGTDSCVTLARKTRDAHRLGATAG